MKKRFSIMLLLASILFVMGCTSDGAQSDESASEGPDEDKIGDVMIGFDQDISTIDPHGSNDVAAIQVRRQMYQTLIAREVDMGFKSGLATEWEQVEDNVWNFKLAEDVTFHNGSEFTADDVKASLERVIDPSVSAPTVFLFDMIEEIEIVDDYEVNIITSYPFAPLPNNLAHTAGSIMSKESIDADYQNAIDQTDLNITLEEYYEMRGAGESEFDDISEQVSQYISEYIPSNPDGTNHVKFVSRSPGENIEFERFEGFRGESNVDNLSFLIIPESGSMMAEMETGGVNVTSPVDMAVLDRVNASDNLNLIEAESMRIHYLGFNTEKEPFNDVNVRQAVHSALNREEIQDGIFDGQATLPNSLLSSSVFGYNEELPLVEQDINRAQELLQNSAVSDGFDATLWVNDSQELMDIAVYIQEELQALNVNLSIEQYENAAYLDLLGNGDHDMFLLNFTASTVDGDYLLSALTHSSNRGSAGNRSFYLNEEVDTALENARSATDDENRQEEYNTIHNILNEEVPYAPLVHPNMTLAFNTDQMEDVQIDAAGYIRLDNVTFN